MTLFEQFQTFVGSFFFGSLALFTWTLFNRIFYSKKIIWLRLPLEIALFCLLSYLYYIFLSFFGSGIFNIFYIFALLFGAYFYYRFYAYHFEVLFESVANSLYKHLVYPLELKRKKICDRLKIRKKEKHEKINKKRK